MSFTSLRRGACALAIVLIYACNTEPLVGSQPTEPTDGASTDEPADPASTDDGDTATDTPSNGGADDPSGGTSEPSTGGDTDADEAEERSAEPWAWNAEGTEDLMAFAWGFQVSDVTADAALLSVRTTEPEVSIRVMRADDVRWTQHTLLEGLEPTDSVVQVELTDLTADTAWSVAAYSPDGERRSRVSRFRTALGPDQSRIIRFGATSCLGFMNPAFPTLSHASRENLDFFLLAGDTVYADGSRTLQQYQDVWADAFLSPGMRDLFSSTSVITTWDDHEVTNNWSWTDWNIGEIFDGAYTAYRDAIPWREGPGGTGLWRRLSWGEAIDIYVLDSRGERVEGRYVSVEQLDWLKAWLLESPATFKIILNSVPITDMNGLYGPIEIQDRWDGYPDQRDEILEHIAGHDIQGVLWVAGDFHFSQLGRIDPPGGVAHDQWEVFAGPGGSIINPLVLLGLTREDEQYKQILDMWTYTWFEANPVEGTIRVKFIDDSGSVRADETLQLVRRE